MDNIKISNTILNWLKEYERVIVEKSVDYDEPVIQVEDVASRLAFLYEKVRNTVDYREDHLIRRHAISRMLRRMATSGTKGDDLAMPLLRELIRARYAPNNKVPESVVARVAHIINKHIVVYNTALDNETDPKELKNFFFWLLDLAACEIEEIISPSPQNEITLDAMRRVIHQDLILEGVDGLSDTEKSIHIYVAILKSLLKADEMTVNYYLMKFFIPNWQEMELEEASRKSVYMFQAKSIIRQYYDHVLSEKLVRDFKPYTVSFWIMQELIEENPYNFSSLFAQVDLLNENVMKKSEEQYKQIRGRVTTAVIRSVSYLFLTKMMIGLILELPYDFYIMKKIHWLSLGINVMFPPVLMAAIGFSIHTPSKKNSIAIADNVKSIVYGIGKKEHRLRIPRAKKGLLHWLLNIFYLALYLVSFGSIIYALNILHFSFVSKFIFLLFLTLVSFFSLRIRNTATELIIVKKRNGFLGVILTFLIVPILKVGRWLSLNASRVNVFIFLLDFIIEAPFKTFVRIFEDFVIFIQEKKDEMM